MKLGESVRISWRSITGHKLRSTLTTLGVIIGIASVITFMVLGGAVTEAFLGDLDGQNEPLVQVTTQTSPEQGTGIQQVSSPIYTESDVDQLREIDSVEYVAPSGDLPAVQLSYGDDSLTGGFTAQATTGEPFEAGGLYTMEEGETFSAPDEVVINQQAATVFSENVTPGDELSLSFQDGSTETFTVSGIVSQDVGGQGVGAAVYAPLDAHYSLEVQTPDGGTEAAYPSMMIRAEDFDAVDAVRNDADDYLQSDSHAAELKRADHTIQVQTIDDVVDQVSGLLDTLTSFIVGIAAISLVVGSIGIANIMIVSVTERTREIGIMKAVGARKRDIVQLFLVESVILGAIGALLGVLLGIGVGYLAVSLLDWPMVYPWDWVAIAVAVGVGVGIVSGLYPAWRAARIDPIEALRTE